MHSSKNTNAKQLANRVFEIIIEKGGIEEFEAKFDHAYDVAIAQYHLSAIQAGWFSPQVKRLSKELLEKHAREAEKKSRLPDYRKLRRPVPLLDCEKFALGIPC
jgi:hypothetical protein